MGRGLADDLKKTNNRIDAKNGSRTRREITGRNASLRRLSDRTPKIERCALAPEALSATIHESVRS